MALLFAPNSKSNLELKFDLGIIEKKYSSIIENITIVVKFRKCKVGEIMKKIGNNFIECFECPDESYSLD